MSVVTNIILISLAKHSAEEFKNKTGLPFKKVDEMAGGDKHFERSVYIASINYFNKDELIKDFKTFKWDIPECVELWVAEQDDDKFTRYTLE